MISITDDLAQKMRAKHKGKPYIYYPVFAPETPQKFKPRMLTKTVLFVQFLHYFWSFDLKHGYRKEPDELLFLNLIFT